MSFPLGTLINPLLDQFNVLVSQSPVGIDRRHAEFRILGADSLVELTLCRVAGHDDLVAAPVNEQTFSLVQTEVGQALLFIRAVAREAGIRKDRTNLTVKVDGFGDDGLRGGLGRRHAD